MLRLRWSHQTTTHWLEAEEARALRLVQKERVITSEWLQQSDRVVEERIAGVGVRTQEHDHAGNAGSHTLSLTGTATAMQSVRS